MNVRVPSESKLTMKSGNKFTCGSIITMRGGVEDVLHTRQLDVSVETTTSHARAQHHVFNHTKHIQYY